MPCPTKVTRNKITATGGQTVFNYTFEDTGDARSTVLVFTLTSPDLTRVEQPINVAWTLDRQSKTVTFLVGLAAGVVVWIERCTSRTRLARTNPASTVTGALLNADEEQSFRYKQELEDKLSRKMGLNDAEDAWDAAGLPIGNFSGFLVTPPPQNILINGDFRVSQRVGKNGTHDSAALFPNDDAGYTLDRWRLLSDGNNVVDVSREEALAPDGADACIKLIGSGANPNKKFGICQYVESGDTERALFGGTSTILSLSFKSRTTTGAQIRNIRAAIIGWDGGADAVDADPISLWQIEGANPVLVAGFVHPGNAGYFNTPTNLQPGLDTWATHKIEGITITEPLDNLAVLIWVDDGDAGGTDELYIADVQLEPSTIANAFAGRPIGTEIALCERYFQKSYRLVDEVGTSGPGPHAFQLINTSFDPVVYVPYRTRMFLPVGSITFVGYTTLGVAGSWRDVDAGVNRAILAAVTTDDTGVALTIQSGASANGARFEGHWTAESEL